MSSARFATCRNVERPRRKSENCRTILKRQFVEKVVEHAEKEVERMANLMRQTLLLPCQALHRLGAGEGGFV